MSVSLLSRQLHALRLLGQRSAATGGASCLVPVLNAGSGAATPPPVVVVAAAAPFKLGVLPQLNYHFDTTSSSRTFSTHANSHEQHSSSSSGNGYIANTNNNDYDNDDGGPVTSATSAAATTTHHLLQNMSIKELSDMSTIPGWNLVHNPPRKNPRGALVGRVVSDKMQKTVNVAVDRYKIIPKYRKRWRFTKKFMAHDEHEVCNMGDLVMIVPCQKISRHKHFMVREIIRPKGLL